MWKIRSHGKDHSCGYRSGRVGQNVSTHIQICGDVNRVLDVFNEKSKGKGRKPLECSDRWKQEHP